MTVPSVFYLIQPQLQSKKSHGHGHGNEGHDEEHSEDGEPDEKNEGGDEGGSSEGKEEESGDQGDGEEKADAGKSNGSGNDVEKEGGAKPAATPGDKGPAAEKHETEGGGNVEGVQFKGSTSGGTEDREQGDTRKHIPDAKGGSKKRIDSDYGKTLGEASEPEQDSESKDLVR